MSAAAAAAAAASSSQQQQSKQQQQQQQTGGAPSRKRKGKAIRAHQNPLSDLESLQPPLSPKHFDWGALYPKAGFPPFTTPGGDGGDHGSPAADASAASGSGETAADAAAAAAAAAAAGQDEAGDQPKPKVAFADVGCGFGGLTVALGAAYPEKLVVGMELRDKVVEVVEERIRRMRAAADAAEAAGEAVPEEGSGHNIAVYRVNAMKHLPNFFEKGQLEKLFFLFPDPHFKRSNHRRRIVSPTLLSEYAYVLAPGALAYAVTDVRPLFDWMEGHFNAHPLFERVPLEELKDDASVELALNSSEESKKVVRHGGTKHIAVFRRIEA